MGTGDDDFSGSEGEKEKKRDKKAAKEKRKKTSKPTVDNSKSRKKKTKLPGEPKRPMSAYFLWLNEEGRDQLKKENPGMSITEIGKKCGEAWRDMSDAKKKWEEKAKEMKEKYDAKYAAWLKDGGSEAIKQAKKEKKAGAVKS